MHIVHIAAELTPVAKVGGLADVLLGLSRELSWKGHYIEIILPKYDCLDLNKVQDLEIIMHDLWSYFRGTWHHNSVWKGYVHGITVYFIESHDPHHFFNRGSVYGSKDDVERFAYFCRASLEFLLKKEIYPQIMHIHDWPTALVAPLFYDMYKALGLNHAKIVFTIHNLEYQGHCRPSNVDDIGLAGEDYLKPSSMQDSIYTHDLNLLKGGIVYSDFVTTVSPNYAQEALNEEGGKGLEEVLKEHQAKFKGILNGIDYSYWNPEIDPLIPYHYSLKDLPHHRKTHPFIVQKEQLKRQLRHTLSLDEQFKPIVSCITRLVSQKGPELIKYALRRTLEKGGQFILLGSNADAETLEEFLDLKTELADSKQVHIELSFHEQLSHLVYAGSDMIIIPSIFEPCGLTQMISMRYGTVPIARQTGGLADTVFDCDFSDLPFEKRNGYCFEEPTKKGIESALDRAFKCWFDHPEHWRKIMENGMKMDFSWNKPSDQYLRIYHDVLHHPAHFTL